METNWQGQTAIKIDEKGRFLIPSSSLAFFNNGEIIFTNGVYQKKPYLELINIETWESRKKALNSLPPRDPRTIAYKRFILSGSAKASTDKQNRVTLPSFLRSYIKLQKEAVLLLIENKLELWSSEIWQQTQDSFIENFENLENWACSENNDSANSLDKAATNKINNEDGGNDSEIKVAA